MFALWLSEYTVMTVNCNKYYSLYSQYLEIIGNYITTETVLKSTGAGNLAFISIMKLRVNLLILKRFWSFSVIKQLIGSNSYI